MLFLGKFLVARRRQFPEAAPVSTSKRASFFVKFQLFNHPVHNIAHLLLELVFPNIGRVLSGKLHKD
jgi:hypothetical protein